MDVRDLGTPSPEALAVLVATCRSLPAVLLAVPCTELFDEWFSRLNCV